MSSLRRSLAIPVGIAAAFMTGAVRADDAATLRSENSRLEHTVAAMSESQVNMRISGDFVDFAGSSANAASLATGLRQGTPITLTTTPAQGQPSATTFAPLTRPMGNGNVFISLALAKQQLAGLGITQPAPEQIKAALAGGTITTGSGAAARTVTLPGVLTLRSQGMGWGQIAKSQGVKLGAVISGMRGMNHDLSAIHMHQTRHESAIVTPVRGATVTPLANGAGAGREHGIVTAAGYRAEAGESRHDTGITVTATGAVRGATTIAAGMNGHGHVKQ